MTDIHTYHGHEKTIGDTAVSGLLNGIVAGAAMAAYLILALGLSGESPIAVLERFGTAGGAESPLMGAVAHLAMSGIYGIVFALLYRWFAPRMSGRSAALVIGVIYGAIMFLVAQFFLLPASGSPLLEIPLHFGIAHLIYGGILGLLSQHAQP
ncbi:MAG: hypothetical protein GC204_12940 [Chloroflexi bacterium]|nr:hypothetical protein [Chloroflexota bacterium]